jgi:hypothetical protein
MSTTGSRRRARLVVATALTAAPPAFCAPSATPTVVWDGGGATASWYEDANWSTDVAPGDADVPLKRVCLPASAVVALDYGDFDGLTDIWSLDMAPGAVLTVEVSGRLLLEGPQASVGSYVRRADGGTPATLVVEGVLGGRGNVTIDGVLRLKRTPSGPPTMTTRYCELIEAGCVPDVATTTPGRTTVGRRGLLRVTGLPSGAPNLQGSSLSDRRVIDVKGELRVESPAYLAVDDGTAILVRRNKQARIVLEGGASLYQGRFAFGDPRAVLDLRGTIAKSARGTGILDLTVKVARSARSEVLGGRLSVGGRKAPAARVRGGSSYGVGACEGASATCTVPVATATEPLVVEVKPPRGAANRSTKVRIAVKGAAAAAEVVPAADIHVTDVRATAAKPMTFTMVLDDSAVGTRTPGSLKVSRDGQAVRNCRPNGTPRSGLACVASRTLLGDGDVRLVVRTQVSSRWKIR